jgi:hypothetical protein
MSVFVITSHEWIRPLNLRTHAQLRGCSKQFENISSCDKKNWKCVATIELNTSRHIYKMLCLQITNKCIIDSFIITFRHSIRAFVGYL